MGNPAFDQMTRVLVEEGLFSVEPVDGGTINILCSSCGVHYAEEEGARCILKSGRMTALCVGCLRAWASDVPLDDLRDYSLSEAVGLVLVSRGGVVHFTELPDGSMDMKFRLPE